MPIILGRDDIIEEAVLLREFQRRADGQDMPLDAGVLLLRVTHVYGGYLPGGPEEASEELLYVRLTWSSALPQSSHTRNLSRLREGESLQEMAERLEREPVEMIGYTLPRKRVELSDVVLLRSELQYHEPNSHPGASILYVENGRVRWGIFEGYDYTTYNDPSRARVKVLRRIPDCEPTKYESITVPPGHVVLIMV